MAFVRFATAGILALWLAAGAALAQTQDVWTGDWQSYWRNGQALLSLTQDGANVTGVYEPDGGRVAGVVDGHILRGTWEEAGDSGAFIFAMDPDGDTFTGRYGTGEYWNGYRDTDGASVVSVSAANTPRGALLTIVAAGNDSVYNGETGSFRFVQPFLYYEGGARNSSNQSRRRTQIWSLIDISTFQLQDAPSGPDEEGGDIATFRIGPAGTTERFVLTFRKNERGYWQLVVPSLAEMEADLSRILESLGYKHISDLQSARANSPRETMRNFALGVRRWDTGGKQRALSALDLTEVPPRLRNSEGAILADYLRQVIDRAGFVFWQEIPDDPNRPIAYIYYRHPKGTISIAPVPVRVGTASDGAVQTETRWLFSRDSLTDLPDLYEAMERMPLADGVTPTEDLSSFFATRAQVLRAAPSLSMRILRLEAWQWIGLIAGTLIALIVALFVRIVGKRSLPPESLASRMVGPFAFTLFAVAAARLQEALGLSQAGLGPVNEITGILVILGLAAILFRLTDEIGRRAIAAASTTRRFTDEIVSSLATGLVKLLIIVGAIIACADLVGLPYEGVLAGLGIGGVALAFAARETVSNLLSGAILLADRPFKRGDLVEVGGNLATIDNVGLRSTRLRTSDDALLVVPNSQLSDTTISNWGKRRKRRVLMTIGLTYDTPAEKLKEFSEKLVGVYRAQPRAAENEITIGVKSLGAYSIDIELWGYFKVLSYEAQIRAQEALILDIVRLAEEVGVSFAFPTQTLHVESGEKEQQPDKEPTRGN